MDLGHSVKSMIGKALRPVHAGDNKLAMSRENLGSGGGISMQSEAFGDGQPIPRKYSGEGANVSPALQWTGVPVEAKELVLLCEDPDAPFPNPFLHWAMFHINPRQASLAKGMPTTARPNDPQGSIQLVNGGKKIGYTGPMPPVGHGVHHYHFQLFAVDMPLTLDESADREDLLKAMAGHVIASGEIVGTYERT